LNCCGVTQPRSVRITIATGSSKLPPNAKKIASTKSRYAFASGVMAMTSGRNVVRKWKTAGNTRKYANAQPM
jgi:hypothetical protein